MKIRKIDNKVYYDFLKKNVARDEQVDLHEIKSELHAYGAIEGDKIIGVCSWFRHRDIVRVKGLYTLREARGKGLGTAMLGHIMQETEREKYHDTFATHFSKGLFEKAGFYTIRERKYPKGTVAYMVKGNKEN